MGGKGEHRQGRGSGSRDGYGRGSRPAHKKGGGICGLIVLGGLGGAAVSMYGMVEAALRLAQ